MPDATGWNRRWYGGGSTWALQPLSWLFALATWLRRAAYAAGLLRATRLDCPVVVVGNLSVGGTGKTPLVIWLARHLRAEGIKVGIASRGHGGRGSAQPVLVDDRSDARLVGDEPLLLHRRAGAPVCVCTRRARAAQLLRASGCELILCDDGLQHYALSRDCEVAVIDGERRLGNGLLLPAGPLREGPWRLKRVDLVVINGEPGAALPLLQPALIMHVSGDEVLGVQPGRPSVPLAQLAGSRVHAVAGIGNPQRFFALLRASGVEVIEHAFPDHHEFTAQDILFADALPVIMTEKDAVKCLAIADARHGYVPVQARFSAADERRLLQRIAGLLA